MIPNLGNLAEFMRHAGKLREMMEKAGEEAARRRVEGTAGGGSVTATASGRMELVALKIDPKLLADGDVELLEDLVVAAVNQALAKARDAAAQSLGTGLNLPPDLNNLLNPDR
jgi:DNA-binding YbaB/EbfC family protein